MTSLFSRPKARKRPDPKRTNTIYWSRGDDSINALHQACLNSDTDTIENILETRPELIDVPSTRRKDTPLIYAVYYIRSVDLVKKMIKACPEAAETCSSEEGLFGSKITPLHLAVQTSASPKIIASLIRASPATLEFRNAEGQTPYELALRVYDNPRARDRVLARLRGEKVERRSSQSQQEQQAGSEEGKHAKKRRSLSLLKYTPDKKTGAHKSSGEHETYVGRRRNTMSLVSLLKTGM